jgi:hypothetical protein
MAETVKIDIFADSSSIKELKQQLLEARNQLSGLESGSEDFIKVAQRAGQLKDQMVDINEQVAIFAGGSKFEQAGTALGQIKDNLMNLDFQGASEKAKGLTTIIQGISFKEATSGLKQLGTTFINLGKALLTNPLFLLATIIIGIVLAIKELMDAIGVTQAIMNAFGKVMKIVGDILNTFILEPLKAISDWLGITSNAADEAADKEVEAAERKKAAYQDAHNSTINNLENEIKVRKAAGEDTSKLEVKLLNEKRAAVKDEIEQDRKRLEAKQSKLKNSKQLTEEEVAELKKETKELQDKIKADKLSYKNATGDIKAFYAGKKKERDDDKEEAKEKAADDAKQAAEDAKAAAKAARDAAKERKAIALEVNRQIIDIELSLMGEGKAKEEAILQESYRRQLEDTKNNASLNAEQKLALTSALEEKQRVELQILNNKWNKIFEDREKETLDRVENYRKSVYDKDKKDRLDDIKNTEELLKTQSDDKIKRLQFESNADKDNLDKKITLLEAQKQAELDNTMATGIDRLLIEQKYTDEINALRDSDAEKEKARARALVDAKLQIATDGFNLVSNLTELFNNGSEESAKKAFNVNKAVGIAQATIQTYQAAQAAYLSQMSVPSPDAPVRATIAAGIAVAAGIANIAKIAKTQYGGSTPSGGNNFSNTGSVTTPAQPSFQLFGTGGNQNVIDKEKQAINNNIQVNSVVSVSEITDTQKKLVKISETNTIR